MDLKELLVHILQVGASDLYLKVGVPPRLRLMGTVTVMNLPPLTRIDVERMLEDVLDDTQKDLFLRNPDIDTAIELTGVGRFRVNLFRQQGQPGMVIRLIHPGDLEFKELRIPDLVRRLCEEPRGLILVTGAAGSGKSTTVAAMINHINKTAHKHIVTIEDPIEYVFTDRKSLVNQRQVGFDTLSFNEALKHVIRQSPDVILIGEIRDLETIMTAISAAETGHLVITTMHTGDLVQTLERLVNYYPDYLRSQIRFELSLTLKGIICQRLVPLKDGTGRTPVFEIMLNTPGIRKLLLEGSYNDIVEEIVKSPESGMTTFNSMLRQLIDSGKITDETAAFYSNHPEELRMNIRGMFTGIDTFEIQPT